MQNPYHNQVHTHGNALSYELSRTDPDRFRDQVFESIIKDTAFGGAILQRTMRQGLDPRRTIIDPSTFHSDSDAHTGVIRLGTAPMRPDFKAQVTFHPERFSYKDEVTWRGLHEVNHKLLFDTADTASMDALTDVTFGVRGNSRGRNGLSGLGSLPHYRGAYKAREDTVELLTMYAYDPGLLAEFTTFLADRRMDGVKEQVGLSSLDTSSADALYYAVEAAATSNL
jgi:hypothetical protein